MLIGNEKFSSKDLSDVLEKFTDVSNDTYRTNRQILKSCPKLKQTGIAIS
jgi:hypothetical protein